jgi:hypothetical protein
VIEEAVSYRYLPSGIMLSCLSMNLPSLQPKSSGRATERLRGCGHQQPASYVALRTSDEPVPFSSAYLSLLLQKITAPLYYTSLKSCSPLSSVMWKVKSGNYARLTCSL